MTKLSSHYREDSSDGLDPEIREYLDREYFAKLENVDVAHPKLLVAFAGGNALLQLGMADLEDARHLQGGKALRGGRDLP